MNLGAAQTELQGRGFDYLTLPRQTLMLNNGKDEFEDVYPWPWLEQTVSGSAPLAVDGLKHVLFVTDLTQGRPLWPIDTRDIAADGDSLSLAGVPEHYWLDGPTGANDTVTIRPWPVGAVMLEARVTVQSPELSASADTPLIPARYHPLWIDFAVVEAYKDSDNYTAAAALRGDINGRLLAVIERYEVRQRQASMPLPSYALSEDE